MSEYIGYKKLRAGPGGIKCPCCNPFHCHPRKSKPVMRRHKRRVDKQRLAKELNEN